MLIGRLIERVLEPAAGMAVGAVLLALAGGLPGPAAAHPHGWITTTTTVLTDADGRAVGIDQEWRFDPLYTAFVLQGVAETPELAAQVIREVAAENLKNLGDHAYFTEIRADGRPVPTAEAGDLTTALDADPEGARLLMRFTLPFAEPVDPRARQLVYAVFDPTYYIDMRHARADDAGIDDAAGCRTAVTTSEPDPSIAALAAALDQDAVAIPSLGRHFAQFVEVVCE